MDSIKLPAVILLFSMILGGCRPSTSPPVVPSTPVLPLATITSEIPPAATIEPSPTATPIPPCYLVDDLPAEMQTSYAMTGWDNFSKQAGFNYTVFYFPEDCPADNLEQDAHRILFGNLIPEDEVGLVILSPINSGTLGVFHQHLIQHEYWQMGPEDYPALLEDPAGIHQNLIFLRADELNGDQTIIGNPETVLTSLAEHEYIHIIQGRNNPGLAKMVWTDKDYQYFIEGYANIGNVSSQRYYFETQAAILILQDLDLMNRSGELQVRIAEALKQQGSDVAAFLGAGPLVYDRHILAFFLRVGGQVYVDGLLEGEISPYLLFTRAGSGDLKAYEIIKEIIK